MSSRVDTDSSDQLVYTLDEPDAPYPNAGSAGVVPACRLGVLNPNQPGIFGQSCRMGDNNRPNWLRTNGQFPSKNWLASVWGGSVLSITSQDGTYTYDKLTDGDVAGWRSSYYSPMITQTIVFKLGSVQTVTTLKISNSTPNGSDSTTYCAKDFTAELSLDNSNWNTVASGTLSQPGQAVLVLNTFTFTPQSALYLRIRFLNNYGGTYMCANEIVLSGTDPAPVDIEPTYPVTLSCWSMGVNWTYRPSYGPFGGMVIKQRTDGVWTYPPPAPNAAIGLRINEYYTDGGFQIGLKTVGDTNTAWYAPAGYPIATWRWNHFGLTYDGSRLKGYVNGRWVYDVAKTGAIDYGNHGPWIFGATPGSEKTFNGYEITDCRLYGYLDDIRIADVARPFSWFQEVWAKAWTLMGGIQPRLSPIIYPVEE